MSIRIRPTLALLSLIALCAVSGNRAEAAVAGRFIFALGNVEVVDAAGARRRASRGGPVEPGETIEVGRGRAQIRFADNALIALSPDSTFRIDEFRYSGKEEASSRSFFQLVKGGLRAVTGVIGKRFRKSWRLSSPVVTIGIRGTVFRTSIDGNRQLVAVGFDPRPDQPKGVTVCATDARFGCIDLDQGQNGVAEQGAPPQRTDEQPVFATWPPIAAQRDEFWVGERDEFRAGERRSGPFQTSICENPGITCTEDAVVLAGEPPTGPISVTEFAGATAVNPVFDMVDVSIDDINDPSMLTTNCCGGTFTEVLVRNTSTLADLQVAPDGTWLVFRWQGGQFTTTVPGPPTPTVLPDPFGSKHFVFGERFGADGSIAPTTGFADFDTVLAVTQSTSASGATIGTGIVSGTVNSFIDFSAGQFVITGMQVGHNGQTYNMSGSAAVNLVNGPSTSAYLFNSTGFIASGGTGACATSCGAEAAGALLGRATAPGGTPVPAAIGLTGEIQESDSIFFGGVLGLSNTSGL